METALTLTTPSGDKISAVLNRDETLEKQRLIFISGGFGSHKYSGRQIGLNRFFCNLGYAVFRLDFLGCGASSGDRVYTTLSKGLEIIDTAMEYLLRQPWLDDNHIGLYGCSYGGQLSIHEAARHPHRYRFMILASPAQYLENIDVEINEWRHAEIMTVVRQPRHISFYDDLLKYNPYKAAAEFNKPVLIMHGVEDEVIPFSQSIKLNSCFPNSTLKPMEGEKHRYQNFTPFEQAMTEFLAVL